MARIVCSAPRGSAVVPLVKTIMEVFCTSTDSRSQIVFNPQAMALRPASRKKSVLRVPKPPVASPGISAATARDFSA